MSNPSATYQKKLDETKTLLHASKRKVSLLAYSRFALFIGLCFCLWPIFKSTLYWMFLPAGIITVIFFLLVRIQAKAETASRFYTVLLKILQAEINALGGNFDTYDEGRAFINFDHPYSFDLDIFGAGSLYQQMNRTSSQTGSQKLATWLNQTLLCAEEIVARQKAFAELGEKNDFRLHFLAKGMLQPFTQKDQHEISAWINTTDEHPRFNSLTRILLMVLPLATISAWTVWLAGALPYQVPVTLSSLNIIWVYSQAKTVNALHRQLHNKFKAVKNISEQLELFEKENFESALLRDLQRHLNGSGVNAGKAIKQLGIVLQNFDARLNIFGSFVFNSLFLFDLQMCLRLQNWKKQFGAVAPGWFETLSTIEVCNSFGAYVYNNPDFVFPETAVLPEVIEAVEMGHPLMKSGQRVNNSFALSGKGKFVIITGSNMSGKSTFLRTTGLNMVLAQTGAPVCAKSFRFSPVEIYTSMRINDSLQQNESYFYAEIKRLNRITTVAAQQKPVLILLDEILRGTNSTDKHTGSEALMMKLTELNATGILATHDLSLGELSKQYPGRFENHCFESVIEQNELYFDYRIREGVCKNLNAVFLMKKMGIM